MSYYAVSSKTGQIVETGIMLPGEVEEWAQRLADELGEEIYVIQGEHAGITVQPADNDESSPAAADVLNVVDSTEAERAETTERLRRWNLGLGIPGK